MSQTAKLFTTGRSQAVRLPAAYRFEGKEVFIRRDEATGDVILSSKPTDWDGFLEALSEGPAPDDFLNGPHRNQGKPRANPFADWQE